MSRQEPEAPTTLGADSPLSETSPQMPTVTLIVPCYSKDRIPDLARLLGSIERQPDKLDELVVVVQRSAELKKWVESNIPQSFTTRAHIVYLDETPRVSRARNAGVDASHCDIVAFADDDAILAEDWVAQTRRFYRSYPDAIGVAGAILPMWDSPSMEWFPRELYWMISCTYWTSSTPFVVRNGYGANMSFRREAFAGGRRFNEDTGIGGWGQSGWRGMGGEEPEFSQRVTAATGQSVFYVPDIRVWHRVKPYRLKTAPLARRAYWEGRFKAWFAHHHGGKVLGTEWSLLDAVRKATIQRLRLGLRHPILATRQHWLVRIVILSVGFGYLDGRLRLLRSPTRDPGKGDKK